MAELTNNSLYVGCGLTHAPAEFKAGVEELKDSLRQDYDVLDFVGDQQATPEEVFNWDIRCVGECGLMLAIADYPSLGLGYEIATANHHQTPTLAVAKIGSAVTRFLLGAPPVVPKFEFERYEDLQEVPDRLNSFAGRHFG